MRSILGIRRVILVVLDGLRPDAIERFDLHHLNRLQENGASTTRARTVTPSITASAMASLFTGVRPERHGLVSDRFHIPRAAGALNPMPRVLLEANYPTAAFVTEIPILFRGIGARIARHLGVSTVRFAAKNADGVLSVAEHTIATQRRGLIVMHWPDADEAGHAHGWMSPEYEAGARAMDAALDRLTTMADIPRDAGTLLVLLSDHGGGGVVANDHGTEHPLDRTIFVTLVGRQVRSTELDDDVSLLDVPATVLWALGVKAPAEYVGRPLRTAFRTDPAPGYAAAMGMGASVERPDLVA
ncbi:MAG TPA: alkaline phosphatase family protein [Gemmatimonadaceae bacterium]|nr:alkaline phosphatase family protein [Gemmatimonadaceae bacterium]